MRISDFRLGVAWLACWLVVPAFALTQFETELLQSIKEAREKGDPQKALMIANLLVEKSPNLGQGYFERADLLLSLQKPEAAEHDAGKLIELFPQSPSAYSLRAKIRLARFDYAGAVDDMTKGGGQGYDAAETVGEALMALGRYKEALGCYEYLMGGQFGPYTKARFPRAMCLLGLGKTEDAIGWFEADYNDGQYLPARYQVILGYCELGRFDEAEKNLATWLEPGPEPTDTYEVDQWKNLRNNHDTALYLAGVLRFARSDFKGAVAQLDQIQPADEMSDDARLLRHVALVRMKRPDDALKAKGELKDAWARVIGRYLRGEMNERELLKAAGDSPDLVVRRARECAAGFFGGQVRLAAGDELGASLLFEKAEAARAIDSAVYALTKVTLKGR